MAQLPWEVVESMPVTFSKARTVAEKCAYELSQVLENSAVKTRISSLLGAFIESMQECEANPVIKQNIKHVSCVSLVKARGVVQIHPSFMGNALKGVYSYLSNLLMQYNEELDGIWLSCGRVRQLDQVGYLTDGDNYGIMSLRVSMRILLFTPKAGNMCAKVTKAGQKRASLLIYGIFGVAARSEEEGNPSTPEIKEGDMVDVDVNDVKVLQKSKWIILSTTMERVKLLS
ncbi:hypothetical protein BgAZ_501480 [Babesia gibsoni]|uniref:RNA polymerase Rpb7-like N-terminal domain-containing protein n=1 Tax=Babesia gibsoni TaxID=33632 RepID=A0AAD8LME7_BABGI|nr:hypothetical protein BgAZ_501480 [Babesia gibsoni]